MVVNAADNAGMMFGQILPLHRSFTFVHLYISSKGLVSAKQLSQTSFTALAASTSSLQFGLLDTDIVARRLTHS